MSDTPLPLVTIAIPTFNRADHYLMQALSSALQQTYSNTEIIVSDNCSIDSTESLVRSIQDHRIRYFKHKENIGATPNTNFCVDQARGDYFLQLHDDDLIDDDFVESCMKAADYSTGFGIIQTGSRQIDAQGNVLSELRNRVHGSSIEDYIRAWIEGKASLYLCCTLFNTRGLKELNGFQSKHYMFEDAITEFKLAAKYGRRVVEDVKASFRQHSDNITVNTDIRYWCEDALEVVDVMCDLASNENKESIRREGMRFLSMLNYNLALRYKAPFKRLHSMFTVLRYYNYRYFPRRHQLYSHFLSYLENTYLFNLLRLLKNKFKRSAGAGIS